MAGLGRNSNCVADTNGKFDQGFNQPLLFARDVVEETAIQRSDRYMRDFIDGRS